MSIASMTGFARGTAENNFGQWAWELKSVNARGLEVRLRLPAGFDRLEPAVKKAIRKNLSRGTVYASLSLKSACDRPAYAVNDVALANAIAWVRKINAEVECAPPSAEGLMALKGVIEQQDDTLNDTDRDILDHGIIDTLMTTLNDLIESRAREGDALKAIIDNQLNEIQHLVANARNNGSITINAIRDKLAQQLSTLLINEQLPEERLVQEAALLAVKADIREELDRLDGHVAAARSLLGNGKAAGRQLDFLTQELNREANTLCSKSHDMALKEIGLNLKTVVDQMREQVQNIE